MALDHDDIHQALTLLGELLDDAGQAPVHLVVCGGSALQAATIVGRTTKDVDVLARRGEVDGEISMAYPLPAHVVEAAAQVARELGLANNWFNQGNRTRLESVLNELGHNELGKGITE